MNKNFIRLSQCFTWSPRHIWRHRKC